MIEPVLLVHGGAGDIPDWRVPLKLIGVRKAARVGYDILSKPEGSVLDAVEAAIKVMEDDEAFNAGTIKYYIFHVQPRNVFTFCNRFKGRGSVLTLKGTIEMDAIIMEGKSLKTGCIALSVT